MGGGLVRAFLLESGEEASPIEAGSTPTYWTLRIGVLEQESCSNHPTII